MGLNINSIQRRGVYESTPDSVYYGATIGEDMSPSYRRYCFLDFSMSTIPVGMTVNKVELSVVIDRWSFSGGTFKVYNFTTAWDEDTITWNNMPYSMGSSLGSLAVSVGETGIKYVNCIGLVSIVNSLRPSGLLSLRLSFYGLNLSAGSIGLIVSDNAYKVMIAPVQGPINKTAVPIKIAPVKGPINKTIIGMKIAPVRGPINKTVF